MIEMSELSNKEVNIESRFICDGNIGTVKYIGSVPPTKGIWLGVEWDDETRGKHNGIHEGHQYFQTSAAKSGSFIRPNKAEFGTTCLSAITEKYGKRKTPVDEDGSKEEKLFIFMKNNNILPIEAVGYDKIEAKQSKLCNLNDVCITRMKVCCAGPENELANAVPNITILDLSENLINSWEEVARITRQLRFLNSLNLSNNRLRLSSDPKTMQDAFLVLKSIILIKMNCNWQQFLLCSKMWPHITCLQVSFNKITSLEVPMDTLRNLEHIDLEKNSITDWSEVSKLGYLPKLKFINLINNGLKNIVFENVPPDGKTSLFPLLEVMYVQNNNLSQWSDINELNKLQSLSEIEIRNNPICALEKTETVWQLIIAKIAGLKKLNRSSVLAGERRGAELDYLKKYGKEWLQVENMCDMQQKMKDDFLRTHPRYLQLINVHGAPEESEMNSQSPSLKTSLMTLIVQCPQLTASKPLIKKLPGSMTIQKFRSLVNRLFKLEVEHVILNCTSTKRPNHHVEMENDLRQLSFYVEDGDIIQVKWS